MTLECSIAYNTWSLQPPTLPTAVLHTYVIQNFNLDIIPRGAVMPGPPPFWPRLDLVLPKLAQPSITHPNQFELSSFNPLKPNSSNYYTLPQRPNSYRFKLWHSGILELRRSAQSATVPEWQILKTVGKACMALNIQSVTTWWHWALKG